MAFLLVGDILGLIDAFSGLELRAVQLELVSIDHKVSEAVFLIDLRLDGNGALIGEATAKLDVMDGEIIVRRFGPYIEVRNLCLLFGVRGQKKATHQEGRTSLSDAIATKLLLASLEQCLMGDARAAWRLVIRVGANVDQVRSGAGKRVRAFTKLGVVDEVDKK